MKRPSELDDADCTEFKPLGLVPVAHCASCGWWSLDTTPRSVANHVRTCPAHPDQGRRPDQIQSSEHIVFWCLIGAGVCLGWLLVLQAVLP